MFVAAEVQALDRIVYLHFDLLLVPVRVIVETESIGGSRCEGEALEVDDEDGGKSPNEHRLEGVALLLARRTVPCVLLVKLLF